MAGPCWPPVPPVPAAQSVRRRSRGHSGDARRRPGTQLRRDIPGFDDVALTPAERQLLAALTPDQATLWRTAAWARKEALLKARGTGLRIEPASVEAYAEHRDGTILVDLDTVALGLPPGFAAALAVTSA